MSRVLVFLPFLYLLLVLANGSTSYAQADISSATLTGKIVDQSADAISNAIVTVISSDRGSTRTARSDGDGIYRVLLLQPGVYTVRIDAQGFQPRVVSDVILTVGRTVVADVQLQLGPINEEINVTAAANLVDT